MQCRFRWWCKWVMNRVPRNESPALAAGKLLHLIFEDAFSGIPIAEATTARCAAFRATFESLPSAEQIGPIKALTVIEDLAEALPLWHDTFPVDEVLEVEEPFEFEHNGLLWKGRPDRVIVANKRVWHTQNRGLAASVNFGTYVRLAKRHYHEHLYMEYLARKYCKPWNKKSKLNYGGTVFNLVRKLKFRTNVGKKNEATKTAAEMFYQQMVSYEMKSPLHAAVMVHMEQHVMDMQQVVRDWEEHNVVPAPNEKMNGGFSGNSEDPYFKVLIGEIGLDDDTVFKDREDTYAVQDLIEA